MNKGDLFSQKKKRKGANGLRVPSVITLFVMERNLGILIPNLYGGDGRRENMGDG